jgi:hypothetical protein
VVLALSSGVARALGTSGGQDMTNPAVDFRVTLTDRDGTRVECTRFNAGGSLQLEGNMGRGHLRIPFANIEQVEFASENRDHSRALVRLKGGETVTLSVRNSLTFYGHTSLGVYQIRARDLQRIDFGK